MKKVIVTVLFTVVSAFNLFSQVDLVVRNGEMRVIKKDSISYLRYNKITIEDGGNLFFTNAVVDADIVDIQGNGGIHNDNSITTYRIHSNAHGESIAKKIPNKKIKHILNTYELMPEFKTVIKVNSKVIFCGYFEDIENNVLKQGIYDIYQNDKLVSIIYNL